MADDRFSIVGESRVERARWLAVRSALKIEIRTGMKRRGKSARVLANEITGESHSKKEAAYAALNKKIVDEIGPDFDKPL
jgi:hypothetical protein